MALFVVLLLSLVLYFIIPVGILVITPGRKTLFLAVISLLLFLGYETEKGNHYEGDRLGMFLIAPCIFLAGVIVGTCIKIYYLRKRKDAAPFSIADYIACGVCFLLLFIGAWAGQSKICWSKMRQLSETEIVQTRIHKMYGTTDFLKNNLVIYYKFSKSNPGFLGLYRQYFEIVFKKYDGRSVKLGNEINACGQTVSQNYEMEFTPDDLSRDRKYFKTFVVKSK